MWLDRFCIKAKRQQRFIDKPIIGTRKFMRYYLAAIMALVISMAQAIAQIGPLDKLPASKNFSANDSQKQYPFWGVVKTLSIPQNNLWWGSNVAGVTKNLELIKKLPNSRSWRRGLQDILTGTSIGPVFTIDPTKPWQSWASLVNLRVQLILKLGDIKQADLLLRDLPDSLADNTLLLRHHFYLQLLQTQSVNFCTGDQLNTFQQYQLLEYAFYCAAIIKDQTMMAQIMAERKKLPTDISQLLGQLQQIVSLGSSSIPAGLQITHPLEWFLIRHMNPKQLGVLANKLNNPAIIASMIDDAEIPLDTRLSLAEQAYNKAELPKETLEKLYGQVPVTDKDRTQALLWNASSLNQRQRAVIWHMISTAGIANADKIQLFLKLLQNSKDYHHYLATLELYHQQMLLLSVDTTLSSYAFVMARAYFAAELPEQAREWKKLAETAGDISIDDVKKLNIWAALYQTGQGSMIKPTDIPSNIKVANKIETQQRFSRVAAILEGVGLSGGLIWPELAGEFASDSEAAVDIDQWFYLSDAVRDLGAGEVYIILANYIQQNGFGATKAQWAAQILMVLRQLGFDTIARQLAIEGLLANGL